MRKISQTLVVSLLGVMSHSFAATEFPDGMAPVALVTEFSGGGSVYSSLPDGFPVAPGLAGLPVTLVGSIDRSGGRVQQVLLHSAQAAGELRATLLSAYAADGWVDVSSGDRLGLCRDDEGQLYFQFSSEGAGTKLVVSRNAAGIFTAGTSCAQLQQIVAAQNSGTGNSIINALRPTFTLPTGAVADDQTPGFVSGTSWSTTAAGTRYEFRVENSFTLSNYSLSQTFQHVAQQLQREGWQVDSDSVGSSTAVSSWLKTADYVAPDGKTFEVEARGFLKLLKSGADGYRVRLDIEAIVPLPPPSLPTTFLPF